MRRALPLIFAATLAAGTAAFVPKLTTEGKAPAAQTNLKGDRLQARSFGAACSQREWPLYESACVRDLSHPSGLARNVRLVLPDNRRGRSPHRADQISRSGGV
jgi:hypothetical protein